MTHQFRMLLAAFGLAAAAALTGGAGTAVAAPISFGPGCSVHPENREATIRDLRYGCSSEQHAAVFRWASAGPALTGVTNGYVTNPPSQEALAPLVWIGKTFSPGSVQNRFTGLGIEGFRGDVYLAPSYLDGRAAWIIDYAPSPMPQLLDEIREVQPGLRIGLGYEKPTGGTPAMRTQDFILTN